MALFNPIHFFAHNVIDMKTLILVNFNNFMIENYYFKLSVQHSNARPIDALHLSSYFAYGIMQQIC